MFDTLKRLPTIQSIGDKISESWLLKKAISGDKESFGLLYKKYMDKIYRYIYFKVGSSQYDAEDLTETVFFKAWNKIRNNGFKSEGNGTFKAWLYRIAHNAVIDYYRLKKPVEAISDEYPLIDYTSDPETDALKKSDFDALNEALKLLTLQEKEVITMKFIDGMDNKEIEKILNKKDEAIRALQYRALKKLRRALNDSRQ